MKKESQTKPTIKLGGVEITTPQERIKRFSLLLWGSSGGGKTTLAGTAPGNLLWINYDPDGTVALANKKNVEVIDFSDRPIRDVELFKEDDPLRLTNFLKERDDIQTVVFDSLTTFGDKALQHGVGVAQGTKKGQYATIEDPGFSGYGNKNTWTRLCVKNLLKATSVAGKNMIFIAHEDKPEKNQNGEVMFISIMLGSSLNEQVPIELSEIWNLRDTGHSRFIGVRNCRLRKPLKSRMFITSSDPEFEWDYDADKDEGEGIKDWYDQWKANKGNKIPLPNINNEK